MLVSNSYTRQLSAPQGGCVGNGEEGGEGRGERGRGRGEGGREGRGRGEEEREGRRGRKIEG